MNLEEGYGLYSKNTEHPKRGEGTHKFPLPHLWGRGKVGGILYLQSNKLQLFTSVEAEK